MKWLLFLVGLSQAQCEEVGSKIGDLFVGDLDVTNIEVILTGGEGIN